MSEISNRAIVIAVGVLVTIAITSSVLMVMGYFKDIYSEVKNTDISLRKMFNEFDPFDGTEITGLDILNGYNKYRNDPTVNFSVNGQLINSNNIDNILTPKSYYTRYDSICERIDDGANINCIPKT